ncbi:acyltransferase family protein [Terriglobus roseus]|uniref:Peptidoglycan/LPS O-acetylase OafA/YrhL, contains acyltransferase and SGNH-hydrolase domains n=1 Tax=Terriglobus roseus TaxID=392734 RepID=A0A1G7MBF7_9BACT|nr:acyltransferase [Terriglobus roseus]SDF59092.1 Peptidoglycan/LPS O-acetylase OafA/YrhL, contains acyltransferase and SGNH-hydrolase domains [Terriglobus roseus]
MQETVPAKEFKGRRFYQPELDALRFVAFLGVLLHHKSNPYQLEFLKTAKPWLVTLVWALHCVGAFGVELFFLLSSYLITRLLLIEVDTTRRLNLKAFYFRRSLRIWPLYFAFLLLCYGIAHLQGYPVASGFWLAAVFFVANWYLTHNGVWLPLALLWTLSIEEQFYVCWPLMMRSGNRRVVKNIGYATIAISQAAILLLMVTPHLPIPYLEHGRVFYNTFVEVQFFGLGALLALWSERRPTALSRSKRFLLAIGGFAALLLASCFDPKYPSFSVGIFSYNVMFVLGSIGVIALFRAFLGVSARRFPNWMLFLGKISYGLYLFNLLATYLVLIYCRNRIPKMLELPVVFLVNVAFAVMAYYVVERPFLVLKSRFEVVRSRV